MVSQNESNEGGLGLVVLLASLFIAAGASQITTDGMAVIIFLVMYFMGYIFFVAFDAPSLMEQELVKRGVVHAPDGASECEDVPEGDGRRHVTAVAPVAREEHARQTRPVLPPRRSAGVARSPARTSGSAFASGFSLERIGAAPNLPCLLDTLRGEPMILVIGEKGSGKSTVLRHIADMLSLIHI